MVNFSLVKYQTLGSAIFRLKAKFLTFSYSMGLYPIMWFTLVSFKFAYIVNYSKYTCLITIQYWENSATFTLSTPKDSEFCKDSENPSSVASLGPLSWFESSLIEIIFCFPNRAKTHLKWTNLQYTHYPTL